MELVEIKILIENELLNKNDLLSTFWNKDKVFIEKSLYNIQLWRK